MTERTMQRPGLFGVHKKRDFLILYTLVFALLAVLTHILKAILKSLVRTMMVLKFFHLVDILIIRKRLKIS